MTVYRMIQRGQLKAYKFGTDLRISEKDFNEFLQQSLIRAKGKATKPRALQNLVKTPKWPRNGRQKGILLMNCLLNGAINASR